MVGMVGGIEGFREFDPYELPDNVFHSINKRYMLITVENPAHPDGEPNAMTAAWGAWGAMWEMPVAFVVVRGEEYRFSRHLIDAASTFSLSYLGDEYADAKSYLGIVSGADDPHKIASAGLTVASYDTPVTHDPSVDEGTVEHTPFLAEAELVFICEKVFVQEMAAESYLDPKVLEDWYTKQGQHALYIVHIKKVLVRDQPLDA